jgi:hypothetical protein
MKTEKWITIIFKKNSALFLLLFILLSGCKKDLNSTIPIKGSSDGIQPYNFNWETVNWMPTPIGQSQIPPPWIGQGSITSVYGIDVANDIKNADGWQLVYNTFDPNSSGALQNPYLYFTTNTEG